MSKILEKIIEIQLCKHLLENKIIPANQSGFKKNHSCCTALMKITDDIFRENDGAKLTLLVLLDNSKAFDTLNHQIIEAIMKFCGLTVSASTLIMDYLSHRIQVVSYNNRLSQY
ncbi:hypothetical protein JTB14_001639 [Gonioctena quinquepunctata]|nr:hypothetical protein JTB14_001639 [Gonioctena quinquepunctata]